MAQMSVWHEAHVYIKPHQGHANDFCVEFLCHPLKVRSFKHLLLLHTALMVFVKHLSSSMCLSEGPNGNHQPDSGGRASGSVLLRSFLAFSNDSECVLVKQAVGAGLWLHCWAACLPGVVCKLLFMWVVLGQQTQSVTEDWPRGLFCGSAAFLIHSVWLLHSAQGPGGRTAQLKLCINGRWGGLFGPPGTQWSPLILLVFIWCK